MIDLEELEELHTGAGRLEMMYYPWQVRESLPQLIRIARAARDVAGFDWGTSAAELYHFDRMRYMEILRQVLESTAPQERRAAPEPDQQADTVSQK